MTSRNVILGVTGSIAAYKALTLVRLFVKNGFQVRVVMTPAASKFVSPLSFSTLSKNSVGLELIEHDSWNNHVELGLWADVMVIAPVTATTLAKMCLGLSDNLVIATYLSARCPVFFAPAMDLDMWKHPATQDNLNKVQSRGNYLITVGHGELASGLVGEGRMAEPEEIFDYVSAYLRHSNDLAGKKIMVTAGPTNEAIDPVRFIGNHSSGLMGISLAEECAFRGAEVELILGPTHLKTQVMGINTVSVVTAEDMYAASLKYFPKSDVAIFAAAVADYKPTTIAKQKVKKSSDDMQISLSRTPDIAQKMGEMKTPGQVTVGFALETQDELSHATEKLTKKNFDFIVLNSLNDPGAGFSHSTNKISIIRGGNKISTFELKSKKEVAADIIDEVVEVLGSK